MRESAGRVVRSRRVLRRVSRRQKKRVALPQRHVECLGEIENRLPARQTAPAFHEADMLLRNSCIHREFELRLASDSAPLPKHCAGRLRAVLLGSWGHRQLSSSTGTRSYCVMRRAIHVSLHI